MDVLSSSPGRPSRTLTVLSWVGAGIALAAVIIVAATHLGEAENFARLLEQAEPAWLGAAFLLQLCTYACAGAVWGIVPRTAGHRVGTRVLARLAMIKLTVDQLVPTGGMFGSVVVLRAMHKRGVPPAIAMEAFILNVITYYAAFAGMTVLALGILLTHGAVPPLLLWPIGAFAVVAASIPAGIWWLLRHKHWQPPAWLARRKTVAELLHALRSVSPARLRDAPTFIRALLLQILLFLIDSSTLWCMLQATGTDAGPTAALAALVIGSAVGRVSFLPGGIGGFEAGCTAVLTLLGLPVEAALTGTLLFRSFSLWLPLLPGTLLARHEIARG